ncbi:MAG: hypothetical protein ACXW4J_10030, partial [Candidatus Deferrimicrobiaceae bacterium]
MTPLRSPTSPPSATRHTTRAQADRDRQASRRHRVRLASGVIPGRRHDEETITGADALEQRDAVRVG